MKPGAAALAFAISGDEILRAISERDLHGRFADLFREREREVGRKITVVREGRVFKLDIVSANRKIGRRRRVLYGDPYFVFDHNHILT